MKSAHPVLVAHLNALRTGDARALVADLYTFTLRSNVELCYTNADVPIDWNGRTYSATSVLVDGLKFKCAAGLDVDQQQITIAARPTDTVAGVPFLQALRNGAFDGCAIQRDRAFLQAWHSAPIGVVTLFKGRIGTIDRIGRTSAEVTVNSDLVLLDIDMPRNIYAPNCQHVLYDTGCGLDKAAYSADGIVEEGTTSMLIEWSGSSTIYKQGTLIFTSGANSGVSATIKDATLGSLRLAYPLLNMPEVGDTFTAYQGCDHTHATCLSKFNNLLSFRGFPYVPPPTTAF